MNAIVEKQEEGKVLAKLEGNRKARWYNVHRSQKGNYIVLKGKRTYENKWVYDNETDEQREFRQCFFEAKRLVQGGFSPELDNLEEDTVESVVFKVIVELDLVEEDEVRVTPKALEKAQRFMKKWKPKTSIDQ